MNIEYRKKRIKGLLYITMCKSVEFIIKDDGEYNPDLPWAEEDGWVTDPEPYGIDEILEQNKHIRKDIDDLKDKGYKIEEISCEDREYEYIKE